MDPKSYMNGDPIPIIDKWMANDLRYYGIARTVKKKRLYSFIVRDKKKIPEDPVVIYESTASAVEIGRLVSSLLDRYNSGVTNDGQTLSRRDKDKPSPGDIVHFSDNERTHTAILLEYGDVNSFVLFLTTNPLWNPLCRRMTREELSFTGWPIRESRVTYLAPVIRPTCNMTGSDKSIPTHRLHDLLLEFNREDTKY